MFQFEHFHEYATFIVLHKWTFSVWMFLPAVLSLQILGLLEAGFESFGESVLSVRERNESLQLAANIWFFHYSHSVAFWLLLNWGFHLANFRSNSSSKYSTAIWLPIGKFPFCSPLLGVSVGEAVEAVVSELEVDVDLSSSFDVGLTWIMEESQMKNILW